MLILAVWTGSSTYYFTRNLSCFSYSGISLVIRDLTGSASYKLKAGWTGARANLIIYQAAVRMTALSLTGRGTVVAKKRATHTTVKVPFPPWLNIFYISLGNVNF
jgi:hypothetical protein